MEENHRLIVASISLSVVFNVFSGLILAGMCPEKSSPVRECFREHNPCYRNGASATWFERWVAIITWVIGVAAIACWAASLGLNSYVGLTNKDGVVQNWYIIGTILAGFDVDWMFITMKYWLPRCCCRSSKQKIASI